MKILINQQGFARVMFTETSIPTEQPIEGDDSNTTEIKTTEAVTDDEITTSETKDSEKIVHKDAPTETASEDSTEASSAGETDTDSADGEKDDALDQNLEDKEETQDNVTSDASINTEDDTTIDSEVAVPEEGVESEDGSGQIYMDGGYAGDGGMGEDMNGMEGTTEQKSGSVMSSWPFVIGISSATLVVSIVLGILLAKKRIKKGFDLYED